MAEDGFSYDPVAHGSTLARFRDEHDFEARVVEADGAVVVTVAGEIDMATAGLLRRALDRASGGDEHVTIDLAGTTFMDSSGLAVLVDAYRRLGRRLDVVVGRGAGPPIRQVLAIGGLQRIVTITTGPAPHRRSHGATGSVMST